MTTRKIAAALAFAALVALAFAACPSPTGGKGGDRVTVTVTVAAIPGVPAPVLGETPVTVIGGTGQYTGTVLWSPLVTGAFAAAKVYTAAITLKPNPGYTFDGVTEDFFTVAGAAATNAAGSDVVMAAFPTTAGTAEEPAVVDIRTIPGVTAPAICATPVTAIAPTPQYTGTVEWSPAVPSVFADETAYTATISLAAKEGFTFDGIAADFFTVGEAASASNAAYSGTVTAAFPATPLFMEMVQIQSGAFTMGSPVGEPERYSDETQHSVTLSGFWMGKYEVTQAQYETVTGTNPSYFTMANGRPPAAGETDGRRPVECVTWYDAVEFCNKVSEMKGLQPVYTISGRNPAAGYPITSATVTADWGSNGYRLPTEAQWEYACRAGTTTAYNTGASISNDTGWYWSNSGSRTHEVGKKPANAWGLHDMHGNV
ncbi:MAG: formylglycine-generating enzyme family protein, partial [Treponema sp.]|nr:formylglycine-generating enzyme family protein [Treponema sp.]